MVIGGSGRIKLDDEVVELRQFDVVRVAPQVVRAFEAGPEGLEVIAVGGRKPEGGDGVRDSGPLAGRVVTAETSAPPGGRAARRAQSSAPDRRGRRRAHLPVVAVRCP